MPSYKEQAPKVIAVIDGKAVDAARVDAEQAAIVYASAAKDYRNAAIVKVDALEKKNRLLLQRLLAE